MREKHCCEHLRARTMASSPLGASRSPCGCMIVGSKGACHKLNPTKYWQTAHLCQNPGNCGCAYLTLGRSWGQRAPGQGWPAPSPCRSRASDNCGGVLGGQVLVPHSTYPKGPHLPPWRWSNLSFFKGWLGISQVESEFIFPAFCALLMNLRPHSLQVKSIKQ